MYENAKLCKWLLLLFLIQYQFTVFNGDAQSGSYSQRLKAIWSQEQPENHSFLGWQSLAEEKQVKLAISRP